MPMQRRQVLAGIGGATMLTVAGCLGDEDQGTTLWNEFEDAEEETLEEHLEAFNEGRENEISADNIADMEDQLETAIPAGDGPATFAWAHDWLGRYHDQEFGYDASGDLNIDLESEYTADAVEAVQWDGHTYGLPFASETVTLMYNPDLVDEPPETLEEMVEIMDDYHDPANNQWGLSYPPVDPYFVSGFLHAFGGRIFHEDTGELGIEDDEFIEGLELLQDNLWEYVPSDPEYGSQMAPFNDGNAPFAINGPWQVGGFRDAGVDATLAPLPDVDGGSPTPYTGIQVWYFTSGLDGADEETLETTIDWAEWYTTNEDVIVDNAERHGLIPVHQEYAESADLGEDVETFVETVEMGTPMPADPRMDLVFTPLEEALERVFNESEEPAEAMEAAAEEIRGRWD
ncbi:sugar ABC transporter substrate-binding protein [Natrialba sp. SSL1]|nr:sugar ABC transporter substrate-binding protein [Natrialba sp. SSL1]